MRIIQFVLVPILAILSLIYFKKLRSKLLDRVIVILIGGTGITMVLFPDLTQTLANITGVGRGVDLVMYLGLTGLVFTNLLLFSKTRNLEDVLTEIVRNDAIRRAEKTK